jgi:hypothetical protein
VRNGIEHVKIKFMCKANTCSFEATCVRKYLWMGSEDGKNNQYARYDKLLLLGPHFPEGLNDLHSSSIITYVSLSF